MAKLAAIEINVDLRQGHADKSYRKWAENHAFVRRMSSAGGTWVAVGINLVNEGISLSVIESLLYRAPQLID